MTALLVFGLTLFLAVLISERAERGVLSTAVLFLGVGFVAGEGVLGLVVVDPSTPMLTWLAELALVSVLFTDGMRVGVRDLAAAWRLPGRALLFGLPLTLLVAALLARWVADLSWAEAFLVGAALSPTDPVFAAAVVGREEIPARLRRLLNVESGLNDGLALPIVLALLAHASRQPAPVMVLLGEAAGGIALGVAIVWAGVRLERSRFFAASHAYRALAVLALGILVFALARLAHANEFLAVFAAGVTVASTDLEARQAFEELGELISELLKLAAVLVFGAVISPALLAALPFSAYLFALLLLLLARPLAFAVALLGSPLSRREWVAAAWFGPRGFASVVYGLLIWKSGAPHAHEMFHLVALAVAASILAHSSTDVLVARWFKARASG